MAHHIALSSALADPHQAPQAIRTGRKLVARSEDGFTLVELLVVMPFLIIVTTLVLSTVVTAFGAESRVQATSQSSSQVTLAFLALDSEVRYASDINQPGQDTSNPPNYYVEFDSDWNTNAQGEPDCTQVEYNNSSGNLQQRSWYSGGSVPTGWQVVASGMQTSVSTNPFSLSDVASPWQLTITITSVTSTGAGSIAGTAQSSFTSTALNTSADSTDENVCGGTP
jgi:type II secretory pathway pseudopilin PulG